MTEGSRLECPGRFCLTGNQMAVKIQNISKSFGEEQALREISMEVEEGMIFGLIGPDGAGKSTLFRIITSLLKPDQGTCEVFGFDTIRDYRKIREIIGYMPGRFSLYYDLSVEENLRFYATVFGTTVEKNYDLISGIYDRIEPFRKRLAGRLSGGMKQKLALSCALIHHPRILILDEPTTGVDAVSRSEFWEMLKSIQQEGITIIVSTPYMDEAGKCDRIGLIQKGSMLSVSKPDALQESADLLIFSLKSDRGVYGYLSGIRSMEECSSAWLFGDELHVTLRRDGDAEIVKRKIEGWNDSSIVWKRINPTIEDRFIEMMHEK